MNWQVYHKLSVVYSLSAFRTVRIKEGGNPEWRRGVPAPSGGLRRPPSFSSLLGNPEEQRQPPVGHLQQDGSSLPVTLRLAPGIQSVNQ